MKNTYDHKLHFCLIHSYYFHFKCKIPFQVLVSCISRSFFMLIIYRNQVILPQKHHLINQTNFQNLIHKFDYIHQSTDPIKSSE
jgi:hypothetical protein